MYVCQLRMMRCGIKQILPNDITMCMCNVYQTFPLSPISIARSTLVDRQCIAKSIIRIEELRVVMSGSGGQKCRANVGERDNDSMITTIDAINSRSRTFELNVCTVASYVRLSPLQAFAKLAFVTVIF